MKKIKIVGLFKLFKKIEKALCLNSYNRDVLQRYYPSDIIDPKIEKINS